MTTPNCRQVKLPIKNRELINSLIYSLSIKFPEAKFGYCERSSSLSAECGEDAFRNIEVYTNKFISGITRLGDRAQIKTIESYDGRRKLSGSIRPSCLCPTTLKGVYGEFAEMAETMTALDSIFLRVAAKQSAAPVELPSLVSRGMLEKAGYLPRDEYNVGRIGTFDGAGHDACLCPAGCLPLYPMLATSAEPLPPSAFTALCRVFRYEGGAFSRELPFLRTWEFRVREIIYLDTPAACQKRKDEFVELMSALLKHFGISFEITTAADIFFDPAYYCQSIFQLLSQTKIECRVQLGDSALALASFNIHADHFKSAFGIKTCSSEMVTACVGFGMERMAGTLLLAYPDRRERISVLQSALDLIR